MTIPASIRNSNPGAIYPGASAKKYGSTRFESLLGGKYKIATFDSPANGAAALFDLLGCAYLDRPLFKVIEKWCGDLYAAEYLSGIEKRTGIKKDEWIDIDKLRDPSFAVPLAMAMARHEAGREYPLSEDAWQRAHTRAMAAFQAKQAPKTPDTKPPVLDGWTPDNELPSPRPENRAGNVGASRKWTLADAWSKLLATFGIGVAGAKAADDAGVLPQAMQLVKSTAGNNTALLVLGGIVAGVIVAEAIKHMTAEDAEAGRYRPSGDT